MRGRENRGRHIAKAQSSREIAGWNPMALPGEGRWPRPWLMVSSQLQLTLVSPRRLPPPTISSSTRLTGSDSRTPTTHANISNITFLVINDLSSKVDPIFLCTNLNQFLYLPLDNNFRVMYIPAELSPNQVNAYPA